MNYNSGAYNQARNYNGVLLGNYTSGTYTSSFAYNRVNLPLLRSKSIDVYVDQGAEFISTHTIRDIMGNAISINGYSLIAEISAYDGSADLGILNAFVSDGKITLNIPSSSTDKLVHSRYVYSVFAVADNTVAKIQHGQMLITNK